MYSIVDVKNDLEGMLHGTTLNKVQNVNQLLYRAARQVLTDIDPQETKRVVETPPIFYGIYDYTGIADLKGNKIIDFYPQINRISDDNPRSQYSKTFDLTKTSVKPSFSLSFNSGAKTIRANQPKTDRGVTINDINTINGNGVWIVGGGASDLVANYERFAWLSGCLQFNLTGASGYIENSTMTAVDLTNNLNQASQFYKIYFPTASDITSVELRWGSDASNYWSVTSTLTQEGLAFQDGWNIIQADWLGSTQVGTPDVTNVNYVRITINTNGNAQTGIFVYKLTSQIGTIFEMSYYSKYLFRDASNVWYEKIPDNVDESTIYINLDTDSYNVFLYQAALLVFQQTLGTMNTFDYGFSQQGYQENINRYRAMYKSEIILPQQQYYQPDNNRYSNFVGRYFSR